MMKKAYMMIFLSASILTACSSFIEPESKPDEGETVCFTASFQSSKSYDSKGKLVWSEGDVILIGTDKGDVKSTDYTSKGALVTLTSSDISEDGRTATFSVSGLPAGATRYYAAASDKISRIYGISSLGIVASGSFGGGTREGEFPRMAVASCAAAENPELSFRNADCILHWEDPDKEIRGVKLVDPDGTYVIRTYSISAQDLQVSGLKNTYLAYCSRAWAASEDMYICLAPGMSFPNGLQVIAYSNPWCDTPDGGEVSDEYYIGEVTTPAVTTVPGLFLDMGNLNERISRANPLKSVSAATGEGSVYAGIDQTNKLVYIHHVPSGDLLTSLTFTCENGYSSTLSGDWPVKTLSCSNKSGSVKYSVKLIDYCGPDDYFRTIGGTAFTDRTWTMVWNDEFKADYVDYTTAWDRIPAGTSAWNCQMDANNADLVTADPTQDSAHHGHLDILANSGTNTTSGALNEGFVTGGIYSAGKHKFSVPSDGVRIDVRAWVDEGKGFWPAIWMTNYENVSEYLLNGGELDILEFEAEKNKRAYQTIHTDAEKDNYVYTNSSTGQWHLYTVIITSTSTTYYVDGALKKTLTNGGTQSSYPFYGYGFGYRLILSAQLSSSKLQWQSQSLPDASQMPLSFKIDFVRCYN